MTQKPSVTSGTLFYLAGGSAWSTVTGGRHNRLAGLGASVRAVFAALTAILAKVGVEGVDPDIATFIRTLVIAVVLGTLLLVTGHKIGAVPARAYVFLTLSGLATGHGCAISAPSA
jgi:hypothetical protein